MLQDTFSFKHFKHITNRFYFLLTIKAKGRTNFDLRENLQVPQLGMSSKGSKSNAAAPTTQHYHQHKVRKLN